MKRKPFHLINFFVENVDKVEHEDYIEMSDDCYNLLITKVSDIGVYENTTKKIIEMEEQEAQEEVNQTLSTRPRRKSHASARHTDMMKW